jgi:hypothetical protein
MVLPYSAERYVVTHLKPTRYTEHCAGTIEDKKLQGDQWVLWYNITVKDVALERKDSPMMGRLKTHIIDTMKRCCEYINEQGTALEKRRGRPSDIVSSLIQAMQRNLLTLQQIPMICGAIQLVLADFQQCFLDLYAKLKLENDMKDRPIMVREGDNFEVNVNWMGAFTNEAKVAMCLWQSGMPVWHIHNADQVPRNARIGIVTSVCWNPDIETRIFNNDPPPTIHTGFPGQAHAFLCRPASHVQITECGPILQQESWVDWKSRSSN